MRKLDDRTRTNVELNSVFRNSASVLFVVGKLNMKI